MSFSSDTSIVIASPLCIAFAAFAANAADLFVSASGTWRPDGYEGTCYTDLRAAINAARSGDTVWMQDGYVCDSGLYEEGGVPKATGSNGGYARACINKAIILRSESGYVDEATGKGATIRGAWHDPANGTALGADAVHCLWVSGNAAKDSEIFGLVFEGGSGGTSASYGHGGGIYSATGCIVSNCVFRNNAGFAGGAVGNGAFTLYNCVLTNNLCAAVGYSGGAIWGPSSAYDCLIVSNRSVTSGGGIGWNWTSGAIPPVYSNCVIVGNEATNNGGAATFGKDVGATFIKCRIEGNTASGYGAISGPATLIDCDIEGNSCDGTTTGDRCGGVGAAGSSTPQPVLTRCRIVGNYTSREGGGLYYCVASNCVISGNLSRGSGGGAYASTLVDCEIVGNVCSNTLRSGNAMDGSGGGLCDGSALRCLIAGNSAWAQNLVSSGCGGGVALANLVNCIVSNNWAISRGAAAFYPNSTMVCYNTLFVGNRSASNYGYYHGFIIEGMNGNAVAANPAKFVNCTIADNYCPQSSALSGIVLVNSIVWNNTAGSPDANIVATNSCAAYLTDAHGPGNIQGDPLFADASAGDYTLGPRSPCRNAALAFDWMQSGGDPRSADLAGNPRLGGKLPDMGCLEHPFERTLISVQ